MLRVASRLSRTGRDRPRRPRWRPLGPGATLGSGGPAAGGGAARGRPSGPPPRSPAAARPGARGRLAELGSGGEPARPSHERPTHGGPGAGRPPAQDPGAPALVVVDPAGGQRQDGPPAPPGAGRGHGCPRERRSGASRLSVGPPQPDGRRGQARAKPAHGAVPGPRGCVKQKRPIMLARGVCVETESSAHPLVS